ncbi:hypothetical protein [Massilia aquatica]|uniref:Uncharacterized protein n=1 Tax=Massilia aquatica TaxID=2609000 RepID=A0ABX0M0M9_9BURK|nr:hypothetical protein [Massilia aquatica]NHZ38583.1 hypothetical protein [Massilia aquatica]
MVVVAVVLLGILFFWAKSRSNSTDWVEVGIGGPKETEFPYRYMGNKEFPPTHPDLVGLTLDLQAGRARGAWVYAQASGCYAPKLRDGIPSIVCESVNRESIIVGGTDNIREFLLSLNSGQVGAVKGKAMGLYADHPVIWVNDPALKRKVD